MKKFQFRIKSRFLTLFLWGFVAGVLYIALFGKTAVNSTSLMSPYFFSKYQYLEFAAEELFVYIAKARLSAFTILWLTGLTVLGTIAAYLYLMWVGAALGITITTAAMKMGIQGILLCIGSGLPHFVLYVPLFCWVLKKICEMSGDTNMRSRQWDRDKRKFYAYFLVWLTGVFLFLVGAFLESYVNPFFLQSFLKNL